MCFTQPGHQVSFGLGFLSMFATILLTGTSLHPVPSYNKLKLESSA